MTADYYSNECDVENLILMIPGPTWVRPAIRRAGSFPEFGHRDSSAKSLIESIHKDLAVIAQLPEDYDSILINGSGTNGMESAIRSLAAPGDRILCVSVGIFGDLFHSISIANGFDAKKLTFPYGQGIDIEELDRVLSDSHYDLVTITQNESSTGVKTDIESACRTIKDHGAMSIVDGVSIFGGCSSLISESRPDIYVTATQKCLAVPAGFSIAFISPDAQKKAVRVPSRGYTTDILGHLKLAKQSQTLTTPSSTLLNQMYTQLRYIVDEEGIDCRFDRHKKSQQYVRQWAAQHEQLRLFVDEDSASLSLTTIEVPTSLNRVLLKDLLRAKGYLIDTGHAKLNQILLMNSELPLIRIPHMGDVSIEMLETFLFELKLGLNQSFDN